MGIVLCECKQLKGRVLTVETKCDRLIMLRPAMECEVWNIVSCYAPQTGCSKEENAELWEPTDSMMQEVPRSERLAVVGDMNGHVGKDGAEYEDVHGGHGIGVEEIQWSVM